MMVHGCAFVMGNKGILVLGESGAGKSLLVAHAIAMAQRDGVHADWVADDQVVLEQVGQGWIAAPAPEIAGQSELRFGGIVSHSFVSAARLDVVVELRDSKTLERLPEPRTWAPCKTSDSSHPTLPILGLPREDPVLSWHLLRHALI